MINEDKVIRKGRRVIVAFNSSPENWINERIGTKRNTVRKIDFRDVRFNTDATHVMITCRDNYKFKPFIHRISNVTDFDGYRIYSW